MLHFRIAAFRGRDPDNPSDRKHPSNGRFCQRMEINGAHQPTKMYSLLNSHEEAMRTNDNWETKQRCMEARGNRGFHPAPLLTA